MAGSKVYVFHASTESGDEHLALLPRKLAVKEFAKYCAANYPDDYEAGTLHAKQIELTEDGIEL